MSQGEGWAIRPKSRYYLYIYIYKYVGSSLRVKESDRIMENFIHISFSVQSKLDWCNNVIVDRNESYLLLNSKLKTKLNQ
jgi:hypothetical protein